MDGTELLCGKVFESKKRMSFLFVSAQYKPSGHASYYLYFIKALL